MTVICLMAALVCGCSDAAPPATAPVPTPAPSSASSQPADDPPGTATCASLAAAISAASLMDTGVVDGIVRASGSADAPVADAAQRLATVYAAAVAAHGTPSEPDKVAAVSAAAADMSGVCADSGLRTAG